MSHHRLELASGNGVESKPVSSLLAESAIHARDVVRGEMHLVLARMRDEVREEGRDALRTLAPRAARVAMAFVLASCAVVLMIAAAVSKLSIYVPSWAAMLIVAGVSVVVAMLLMPGSSSRESSSRAATGSHEHSSPQGRDMSATTKLLEAQVAESEQKLSASLTELADAARSTVDVRSR